MPHLSRRAVPPTQVGTVEELTQDAAGLLSIPRPPAPLFVILCWRQCRPVVPVVPLVDGHGKTAMSPLIGARAVTRNFPGSRWPVISGVVKPELTCLAA